MKGVFRRILTKLCGPPSKRRSQRAAGCRGRPAEWSQGHEHSEGRKDTRTGSYDCALQAEARKAHCRCRSCAHCLSRRTSSSNGQKRPEEHNIDLSHPAPGRAKPTHSGRTVFAFSATVRDPGAPAAMLRMPPRPYKSCVGLLPLCLFETLSTQCLRSGLGDKGNRCLFAAP